MATWPSLPGLSPTARRTRIDKIETFENAGGNEVERRPWGAPKYQFEIRYNLLSKTATVSAVGQTYNGYTELATLAWLIAQSRGSGVTHTFTDPFDGTSRTVKVAEDPTFEEDEAHEIVACTVTLRTVLP